MNKEYPEELRRVLGVRYFALCVLEPERHGFDLPQLLWATEPFDAAGVERELLDRGWRDVSVRSVSPDGGWVARVGGDPPAGDRWVGFLPGQGPAGRVNVARWPHRGPYLIMYGEQDRVWRATAANVSLYDKYDNPLPGRIGLTPHQADLLARAQGRPLPTDADVAAALKAESDLQQAFAARRDRFYAARTARFAAETAGLRAEAERLAAVPPPLHRERTLTTPPAVPVRLGESFPLVRFLVGLAHDGPARARAGRAYRMRCNRLDLTIADGVTLDLTLEVAMLGGPFWGRIATPYVPAEADLVRDPAFPALKAPSPPHVCLSSEVFPASPLHLTIRGEVDPATGPDPWRPLGIVLTFPGGPEYVFVPLVATGGNPAWHTARRYDPRKGAVGPEVNLFVPDDINLLKPVRARLVPASARRRD